MCSPAGIPVSGTDSHCLFHNEVDDLAGDIDLLDQLLALHEGSDALVGFCSGKGCLLVGVAGDLNSRADLSVDLYADLDHVVHSLGGIEFRPCGNSQEACILSFETRIDLLSEVRGKRRIRAAMAVLNF